MQAVRLMLAVLAAAALLAGCESSGDGVPEGLQLRESNAETSAGQETTAAGRAPETPATKEEGNASSGSLGLGAVQWLHTNVSGWQETATLQTVKISGGSITLDYNKAGVWPAVDGVNANAWIFVERGGKWYGATWEWLRPGQTVKSVAAVRGDHIKAAPLHDFVPVRGETYGFMVSGLARDKRRNVLERSNVVMVRWP
jgi:hypothetical protein